MAERPSRVWKELPVDLRVQAADAFWRDRDSPEIEAQHAEAVLAIARRLNFRAKSVQHLPVERRAKLLAQMSDVSDLIATRALVAYHFTAKRPLMAAFLDALGVEHDNGLITIEELAPPPAERLAPAIEAVRAAFPTEDVTLYLRTLTVLDAETWTHLEPLLAASR